jgi:uncharacterized protein YndB with AHSA1/START domain
MKQTPDRSTKEVLLRAPPARVWKAITDARQFGSWFGVTFPGPFVAGAALVGSIVPTTVDEAVARSQRPYTGRTFEITVEAIEPMRRFAFRWHPFAIEPGVDYSAEPTTLVEFLLEPKGEDTQLTIVESGFDRIPLERRAKAFSANEGGWVAQTQLLTKFLVRPAGG